MEKAHGRAKQFGGHAMAAIVLQSEETAPTPAPPLLSGTDVQSLLEAVEASAPPAEDETEDDRHARADREFLALLDTYKAHYDFKLGNRFLKTLKTFNLAQKAAKKKAAETAAAPAARD